ncbi:MAG: protein-L-isoaspartate(D-aspartate) O-methyltransferase [Bacteroidales bacterium]|nr:protein-L-isoaspartate(D-aspartate) O-methyltransferase [Bacteroidales bacterium]
MSFLKLICILTISFFLQADKFTVEREKMVKEQIVARGITDKALLKAFYDVERHLFVPEEQAMYAYYDGPLPIGYGQTISQPYIVAYMTDALEVKPTDKVLEIGTGSGYQAAILAKLAKEVFTIEIVKPLGLEARERLKGLNYNNVQVKIGDGYAGWKEFAPFNKIMITAAAPVIPEPLLEQLAEGGKLIMPVGAQHATQQLVLAEKKNGKIRKNYLLAVRFVPFTRE